MRGRGLLETFPKIHPRLQLFQRFIRFGDETHPLPSNQQISQTLAEFTESIDVVGARKNRIESAANISDVLEVFSQNICSRLWSRIVFFQAIFPCCCRKLQHLHLCDIFSVFFLSKILQVDLFNVQELLRRHRVLIVEISTEVCLSRKYLRDNKML